MRTLRVASIASIALLAGTAIADGLTEMTQGEGGSVVSGSAGPSGAQEATAGLETCPQPMAALAVQEPQSYVISALARYKLQSPSSLIRLLIQQSNCFIVVERGLGMRNMQQERSLAQSGELREGSNIGGGQMVAADFVLTPAVVFSDKDAGGIGGALGARLGGTLGGLIGGLKFKEAQTSMLLVDARSGVQVAAAEGSSKKADLNLGVLIGLSDIGVGLGGYDKTAEGKIIAASLTDNYNGIVRSVRNAPSLQRNVGSLTEEAAAGVSTAAGQVFNLGDVLRPKIANVKIYRQPDQSSPVVTTLDKSQEMIYMGEDQNGFINVESGSGGGWIKRVLVQR
jgi:curli biogenesis system outer membrane secretion channel CsgG